jgi:hypothetical protein
LSTGVEAAVAETGHCLDRSLPEGLRQCAAQRYCTSYCEAHAFLVPASQAQRQSTVSTPGTIALPILSFRRKRAAKKPAFRSVRPPERPGAFSSKIDPLDRSDVGPEAEVGRHSGEDSSGASRGANRSQHFESRFKNVPSILSLASTLTMRTGHPARFWDSNEGPLHLRRRSSRPGPLSP